jgi:hypothetical protein
MRPIPAAGDLPWSDVPKLWFGTSLWPINFGPDSRLQAIPLLGDLL